MSMPDSHRDDGSEEARGQILDALARARSEGKRVAVIFTADWCPDAQALEAAMGQRSVSAIVEPSYVYLRFDVGQRDRHVNLMADYGMDPYRGIPALAILDGDGTLLMAQRNGELSSARSLPLASIAEIFHRWQSAPSPRS